MVLYKRWIRFGFSLFVKVFENFPLMIFDVQYFNFNGICCMLYFQRWICCNQWCSLRYVRMWLNTILCLHNKVFLWSYEITYHVSNMIIGVDTSYSRRVAGHLQLLWDTILVSLVILTTSQKVILPWLIFLAPGRRSFNSSLVSWKWIQLSCLANLIMYILSHPPKSNTISTCYNLLS